MPQDFWDNHSDASSDYSPWSGVASEDACNSYIARLPTELVRMVFRHLYEDARRLSCLWKVKQQRNPSIACPDNEYEWVGPTDYRNPNFFPFNVAATCRRWLFIACDVPLYWKRVYIYVGRDPTPLEAVRHWLDASGRKVIQEVVVTRRNDFDRDDALESDHVATVAKIIMPHIHRIESLNFDVIHVDSLPTPCKSIHGEAVNLKHLTLLARRGTSERIWRPPAECTMALHCPSLEKVEAEAEVFLDGVIGGAGALLHIPRLRYLHLRPQRPDAVGNVRLLPIDQLMQCLVGRTRCGDSMENLRIEGVSFCRSQVQGRRGSFSLTNLSIQDLTATAVADILAYASENCATYVTIANCGIAGVDRYVNTYNFNLADPPAQDDPMPLLRNVHAKAWEITNCARLTDDGLAEFSCGGPDDDEWISPNLSRLYLAGCPNVTLAGVRRLVEARLSAYQRTADLQAEDHLQPVSTFLSVHVFDCGHAAEEDIEWLQANVEGFSVD